VRSRDYSQKKYGANLTFDAAKRSSRYETSPALAARAAPYGDRSRSMMADTSSSWTLAVASRSSRCRADCADPLADRGQAFGEARDDLHELVAPALKIGKRCVKALVDPSALQRTDRNDPVIRRIGHANVSPCCPLILSATCRNSAAVLCRIRVPGTLRRLRARTPLTPASRLLKPA
jgi:hypothetical protein